MCLFVVCLFVVCVCVVCACDVRVWYAVCCVRLDGGIDQCGRVQVVGGWCGEWGSRSALYGDRQADRLGPDESTAHDGGGGRRRFLRLIDLGCARHGGHKTACGRCGDRPTRLRPSATGGVRRPT